ncbi:MAG: TPM domain-containing protein [Blautia sp.]|nr:TPM domain-containing protein [Blautia sp.]
MKKFKSRLSRLSLCIALLLCSLLLYGAFCPSAEAAVFHPELLDDSAGLLDDEQFETLNCRLFDISQKYQFNVAVITTNSLGSYDAQGYANQIFVSRQYGYEATNDGILLLVSLDQRDWCITRDGYGYTAFTDAGLEYISDKVLKKLSSGDYYGAFTSYADLCEDFLEKAGEGQAYDDGNLPRSMPSLARWGIIVGLGGLLGVGVTLLLKMQLKSVRTNPAAGQYIRKGSFHMVRHEDVFLYSRVSRMRKPKNNTRSGSSGGGNHSGPSGISGKF